MKYVYKAIEELTVVIEVEADNVEEAREKAEEEHCNLMASVYTHKHFVEGEIVSRETMEQGEWRKRGD